MSTQVIKSYLSHATTKNIFWLLIERGCQIIGGILVSGLLARHFGVVLFGQWQYAQTVIAITMTFTWLCGAEVILPRLSTTDKTLESKVLVTAFVIRFFISICVSILFYSLIPIIFEDPTTRIILLGLGLTVLFREPSMVAFTWFQSRTNTKPALIINIIILALKFVALFLLTKIHAKLIWFAVVWSFETIFTGFFITLLFIERYKPLILFDKAMIFLFLRAGVAVWIGLISMYALFRVDRLFLEHALNPQLYGLYAAATQLNDNWIAIGTILSQAVSPMYIYNEVNKSKLKNNIYRLIGAALAISIFGSLSLWLISSFMITLVFGKTYLGSIIIFKKIIWLSIIVNTEAILNTIVLKHKAVIFFVFKWLTGLLFATALNFWLVPLYGVNGGILATYISMFIVFSITCSFVAKYRLP